MPDVYQPVKSGDQKNGTILVYADKFGNTQVLNAKIEVNQLIQQSGALDQRFDDKTYYST